MPEKTTPTMPRTSRSPRRGRLSLGALICTLALASQSARADQARDFMVGIQPEGPLLMVDTLFPGIQATLQTNFPIYGQMNMARVRVNSLLTVPFYESQMDVELRILLLTVGVSGGFRDVFRGLQFDPDESTARGARRGMESDAKFQSALWSFAEFRLELAWPLNDHVVFLNRNAFRSEQRPERTFDYRTGVVHDGLYLQADYFLFFKHKSLGAIAPTFQVLRYELDGDFQNILNVGVMMVTRPGWMRRDDILLLQVQVHPGDALGGDDASAIYGSQAFYGPWSALLAYRVIFELGGKDWDKLTPPEPTAAEIKAKADADADEEEDE